MITVHHLNFSRSMRVLWLMEELGLKYNLVKHERTAQFRSPDTLKAVSPLGKAPCIEDGSLVLAESGVVLDYINTRYGGGKLAPPAGTDASWVHNEWLHYAESSAALPIMMDLLGKMTGGGLPAGLSAFTEGELAKTLKHIETGIGNGPFLMDELFTIADIQLAYLLMLMRRNGRLESSPVVSAYLDRLEQRPAYTKALEIGGPVVPPG